MSVGSDNEPIDVTPKWVRRCAQVNLYRLHPPATALLGNQAPLSEIGPGPRMVRPRPRSVLMEPRVKEQFPAITPLHQGQKARSR